MGVLERYKEWMNDERFKQIMDDEVHNLAMELFEMKLN